MMDVNASAFTTMNPQQQTPLEDLDFRLLRLNDVLKIIPVSRASFYEGIEKGHYPKPLKIGKKLSVWKLADIRDLVLKIERENNLTKH